MNPKSKVIMTVEGTIDLPYMEDIIYEVEDILEVSFEDIVSKVIKLTGIDCFFNIKYFKPALYQHV